MIMAQHVSRTRRSKSEIKCRKETRSGEFTDANRNSETAFVIVTCIIKKPSLAKNKTVVNSNTCSYSADG